jgi:hypothetical protein
MTRIELLQGTLDMLILQTLRWGSSMATALRKPSAPVRATFCRLRPALFIRLCIAWNARVG